MTELEAYKLIIKSCFELSLNLNDTFHYASADAEELQAEDIEEILPIIQKHGYHALVAYAAISRGYDPGIPQVLTPEFYAAKLDLEPLAANGTILFEKFYDRKLKK